MFYVYELRDETGKPFYIGKGKGNRCSQHECKARRGIRSHVCSTIRRIWGRGGAVKAVRVFETADESAAFFEEKRLIAYYGRRNLTNKTDGGDGPSNPTAAVRAKIAAGRRGCIASEATRNRQRLAKLGTHRTAETKAKISRAMQGRKAPWARVERSAEYKARMSERLKGRIITPEHCANISASKLGHKVSKATRRKISESKKGSIPWNKNIKVRTAQKTIA